MSRKWLYSRIPPLKTYGGGFTQGSTRTAEFADPVKEIMIHALTPVIQGCRRHSSAVARFLKNSCVSEATRATKVCVQVLPRISDEQSPDKVFGKGGCRVEIALVEVIVDGGDVAEGLVTRLTQKRRPAAQQSETARIVGTVGLGWCERKWSEGGKRPLSSQSDPYMYVTTPSAHISVAVPNASKLTISGAERSPNHRRIPRQR